MAKRSPSMLLADLRRAVLEGNLELVRRGLVLFTFGNASGISRKDGLVVIKPSGVPYDKMKRWFRCSTILAIFWVTTMSFHGAQTKPGSTTKSSFGKTPEGEPVDLYRNGSQDRRYSQVAGPVEIREGSKMGRNRVHPHVFRKSGKQRS